MKRRGSGNPFDNPVLRLHTPENIHALWREFSGVAFFLSHNAAMKRLFIITILSLSILFKPTLSYCGPVGMVLDNIELLLPGFGIIIAVSYAYYNNPEYQKIIKKLNNSLSKYPKMGKMAADFIFGMADSLDYIIPDIDLFKNIDVAGIKLAAKRVSNDISFDNSKNSIGNCDPNEHKDLQDRVENACGAAKRCEISDTIDVLNSKIGKISSCINSRRTINDRCYNGGDIKHKQSIDERINSINNCKEYISKIRNIK